MVWIVLAGVLVVFLLLVWWAARMPSGPGAERAAEFRKKGGWSPL